MTTTDITFPFDTKNWADRQRRTLNKLIFNFVETLRNLNGAYATQPWFQSVMNMHQLANFGKDDTQNTSVFLPLVGLESSRGHSGFYEELVKQIPFLGNFLSVQNTSALFSELPDEELKALVLNDSTRLLNLALQSDVLEEPLAEGQNIAQDLPRTITDGSSIDPDTLKHLLDSAAHNAATATAEKLEAKFSSLLSLQKEHSDKSPSGPKQSSIAAKTDLHVHSLQRHNIKVKAMNHVDKNQSISNKLLPYFHDGKGYSMMPHAFLESKMPKIQLKHFADTVGLVHHMRIHAAQFDILITDIERITTWDPHKERNPPTSPYKDELTYQCDHVYSTAANKIFTKLSTVCTFEHNALHQVFISAGQYADGYVALYYLQEYGNPKFRDQNISIVKPTLNGSRNIALFCRNLYNYGLYMTLAGDPPTKVSQYDYVVAQIRQNFPGEYDRGLAALDVEVNLYKAMIKQPLLGPTIPFPPMAEIEGNRLALSLMSKYGEEDSAALFGSETDAMPDGPSAHTANVSRAIPTRRTRRNEQWKSKKAYIPRDSPQPRFKFRDGIFCEICGAEGHDHSKDGCFAAGRFLRILEYFDPSIHKRISRKYPKLTQSIEDNLNKSILERASKRKARTAKTAAIDLACNAFDSLENEDCAKDICINAAYTVFPDMDDISDDDLQQFEDASSSS